MTELLVSENNLAPFKEASELGDHWVMSFIGNEEILISSEQGEKIKQALTTSSVRFIDLGGVLYAVHQITKLEFMQGKTHKTDSSFTSWKIPEYTPPKTPDEIDQWVKETKETMEDTVG